MTRFSKQALLEALNNQITDIEAKFGFDRDNGTAQLIGDLSGQDASIAYGEYRSKIRLVNSIEDGSLFRGL